MSNLDAPRELPRVHVRITELDEVAIRKSFRKQHDRHTLYWPAGREQIYLFFAYV